MLMLIPPIWQLFPRSERRPSFVPLDVQIPPTDPHAAIPCPQSAISPLDLEASLGSHNTMSDYRNTFVFLQRQQNDIDNARLHREWLRFILTEASAKFVMEKHLRYGELRELANLPVSENPAWVGKAYQEAPRALSMDATQWTHWETPMCPWTTWKASWEDRTVHPPPKLRKLNKRSWRDRILGRNRKAKPISAISNVTASNPHHGLRKIAKAAKIAKHRFVEHLIEGPEYKRNEDRLRKEELGDPKNPSFPEGREGLQREHERIRRELAQHRHQNRVVVMESDLDNSWQEKTGNFIDREDYPLLGGDGEVCYERERKKRNWFRKWFFFGLLKELPPKRIYNRLPGTAASDGMVEYDGSEGGEKARWL